MTETHPIGTGERLPQTYAQIHRQALALWGYRARALSTLRKDEDER